MYIVSAIIYFLLMAIIVERCTEVIKIILEETGTTLTKTHIYILLFLVSLVLVVLAPLPGLFYVLNLVVALVVACIACLVHNLIFTLSSLYKQNKLEIKYKD